MKNVRLVQSCPLGHYTVISFYIPDKLLAQFIRTYADHGHSNTAASKILPSEDNLFYYIATFAGDESELLKHLRNRGIVVETLK